MNLRRARGERGEALVAAQLEGQGFEIVARNVRIGRSELDIVACRADLIVFCEVRTRHTDALVAPAESIDRAKVARVRKAAAAWLASQSARYREIRFDAAAVVLEGAAPTITYYEDAF